MGEDIVSQINAFKTGRLNKMEKDVEAGVEINIEEAKKEILGKELGEKHSTVFLRVEALDTLKQFADSDQVWRQNSLALAKAEADEDDSPAVISEAAKSRRGSYRCLLHNHLPTVYGLLERNSDSATIPSESKHSI